MSSDALRSSESFIRALKAPSDPPAPNGPSKIELATQAWSLQTLYIPSKPEVITEWIITKLLKEKGRERDPCLDTQYWALLSTILHEASTRTSTSVSRTLSSWIVPLLNRTPIIPILGYMIRTLSSHYIAECETVFRTLLPFALPKANYDAALECYWDTLSFLASFTPEQEVKLGLCELSIHAFEELFAEYPNKKKTYTTFLESHLPKWFIACSSFDSVSDKHPVYTTLQRSGHSILFSPDVLRPQIARDDPQTKISPLTHHLVSVGSLSTTSISPLLKALPHLLQAFIHNLRKFRTTVLPSQSTGSTALSSKSQVRNASIDFFVGLLDTISSLVHQDQGDVDAIQWKTRLALLGILKEEALTFNLEGEEHKHFERLTEESLRQLQTGIQTNSKASQICVDVLATLLEIDYDITSPLISSILPTLAPAPLPLRPSSLKLLSSHLAFHSKTRTLDILLQSLVSALLDNPSLAPMKAYTAIINGPLLSTGYGDELGTALRSFLTPSQISTCVLEILDAVQHVYTSYLQAPPSGSSAHPNAAASPQHVRKKRRVTPSPPPSLPSASSDLHAIQLVFLTRLLTLVLSHAPLSILSPDESTALNERFDYLCSDVIEPVVRSLSQNSTGFAAQLVAAAMLRLASISHSTLLGQRLNANHTSLETQQVISDDLLELVKGNTLIAELEIEVLRAALQAHTLHGSLLLPLPDFIDVLISRLDVSTEVAQQLSWSGLCGDLLESKDLVSVALWEMALDRWLPIINTFGSAKQIEKFVETLLRLNSLSRNHAGSNLTIGALIRTVLQNASFWEMGNIRVALLAAIDNLTVTLQSYDTAAGLSSLLKKDTPSLTHPTLQTLEGVIAAFQFALVIPTEYFGRISRAQLVRRALSADVCITYMFYNVEPIDKPTKKKKRKSMMEMDENKDEPKSNGVEWRALLRTFVARVLNETGAVEPLSNNAALMIYMASSRWTPIHCSETLSSVTLGLLEASYLGIGRSLPRSDAEITLNTIINEFNAREILTITERRYLLTLFRVVSDSIPLTKIPSSTLDILRQVLTKTVNDLRPRLDILVETESALNRITVQSSETVEAWCTVLRASLWLNGSDITDHKYGVPLIQSLFSRPSHSQLDQFPVISYCRAVLAVLVEELHALSRPQKKLHMEIVIAAYIALQARNSETGNAFDAQLARCVKCLDLEEYSQALTSLETSLDVSSTSLVQNLALIRASDIFMRHSPDGSSKVDRRHTTRCLQALTDWDFTGHPILTLDALTFVLHQCSDKASSLRAVDVGCIFTLSGNILRGHNQHSTTTSSEIYQQIVSILTALVRLRRDLVAGSLPHFSFILSRLIVILRAVRPELGTVQKRLVTDSLPSWINPLAPLQPPSAKALARLLTALTTKTTIRQQHSSADSSQKAQSLVQPFSKHAPYVLVAYLRALVDPLSTFSFLVRRELESGVFALCEMMGELGRDSIMAGMLDGSGQAMLKVVWKEYDKQRYTGRG